MNTKIFMVEKGDTNVSVMKLTKNLIVLNLNWKD